MVDELNVSKLSLLHGSPISIGKEFHVHPLTIGQIENIGEEKYQSLVGIFLLSKETIEGLGVQCDKYDIDEYDILRKLSYDSDEFKRQAIDSFALFLQEEIKYIGEWFVIIKDKPFIIDNDFFSHLRTIIHCQNYLSDTKANRDYKPMNKMAEKLMEKEKKMRALIQKKNKDKNLQLADLVSIVAAYSNAINIQNVWDLTLYQLYEAYIRISMWDDFHINYQLLPWSNDQKIIKHHWSEKTDQNKI